MVQPVPTFNLTTGYPLNTTLDVLASFRLDDKPFHADDVRNITLDESDLSWLSYDANNMSLFGIPPTGQESTTLPITITDKYGDSVNTTIAFAFFPSHFSTDKLDPGLANPGQAFNVSVAQYLMNGTSEGINLTTTYNPQKASSWFVLSL